MASDVQEGKNVVTLIMPGEETRRFVDTSTVEVSKGQIHLQVLRALAETSLILTRTADGTFNFQYKGKAEAEYATGLPADCFVSVKEVEDGKLELTMRNAGNEPMEVKLPIVGGQHGKENKEKEEVNDEKFVMDELQSMATKYDIPAILTFRKSQSNPSFAVPRA